MKKHKQSRSYKHEVISIISDRFEPNIYTIYFLEFGDIFYVLYLNIVFNIKQIELLTK